jgi:hypothetical protein
MIYISYKSKKIGDLFCFTFANLYFGGGHDCATQGNSQYSSLSMHLTWEWLQIRGAKTPWGSATIDNWS